MWTKKGVQDTWRAFSETQMHNKLIVCKRHVHWFLSLHITTTTHKIVSSCCASSEMSMFIITNACSISTISHYRRGALPWLEAMQQASLCLTPCLLCSCSWCCWHCTMMRSGMWVDWEIQVVTSNHQSPNSSGKHVVSRTTSSWCVEWWLAEVPAGKLHNKDIFHEAR